MYQQRHETIRPGACARCGGAGYFDGRDEDWRCLLCGRTLAVRSSEARPAAPPLAA